MTKKRRHYSRSFKLEAVQRCSRSKHSTAHIARDLGIPPNTLYRWRRQYAEHGQDAFPGKGKLHNKQAEIRRLKRENERIREEIAILKLAQAFFKDQES